MQPVSGGQLDGVHTRYGPEFFQEMVIEPSDLIDLTVLVPVQRKCQIQDFVGIFSLEYPDYAPNRRLTTEEEKKRNGEIESKVGVP